MVLLQIVAAHSFSQSVKETVTNVFGCESSESLMQDKDGTSNSNSEVVDVQKFEQVWNLLYSDCLSALETCVEGDLKHFHKARYMLSQGLHRRGGAGDLEKAKEELSFCFKSSRSSFTVNMWEIDSMVKKGRYRVVVYLLFIVNVEANYIGSLESFTNLKILYQHLKDFILNTVW